MESLSSAFQKSKDRWDKVEYEPGFCAPLGGSPALRVALFDAVNRAFRRLIFRRFEGQRGATIKVSRASPTLQSVPFPYRVILNLV